MITKTTTELLGEAREAMQHLVANNAPLVHRAQHERLINNLKEQLAAEGVRQDVDEDEV